MSKSLLVPFGYGTDEKSLDDLTTWLLAHHHPEYVRRLVNWLAAQGGQIGVGGGWRAGGAQPDKPGFAPEGKSFHQDQAFNDGFCGAAAVDLVARNGDKAHRSPTWDEVPAQGSAEAKKWGVHCNVGAPGQVGSEPWHMQPVEIDGWQTWWNQGRPSPAPNYPIPGDVDPSPQPDPDKGDKVEVPPLYIGRSQSGEHKGRILISNGVACHVVPENAEGALAGRMDYGMTNFVDIRRMTPVTKFEDIPALGGAWVVQMGTVLR